MQSHIRKVRSYLAVTCHLHFWQNDWGLLHAAAVIGGGMDTEIESAQKADPVEENYPVAPAGIQTCNLSITSPAL